MTQSPVDEARGTHAAFCKIREEDTVDVIEILVEEHKNISELLTLLQVGADRIVGNRPPPIAFFETGLRHARQYADQAHHFKEEYLLFGMLAQKRNGELDGHIERHRQQHEACRNLIQAVSAALPGYANATEDSLKTVHRNTTEYVRTLRSHIRSENEVFFPLAEAALTRDEAEGLLAEFGKYEKKHKGVASSLQDGLATMRTLLG